MLTIIAFSISRYYSTIFLTSVVVNAKSVAIVIAFPLQARISFLYLLQSLLSLYLMFCGFIIMCSCVSLIAFFYLKIICFYKLKTHIFLQFQVWGFLATWSLLLILFDLKSMFSQFFFFPLCCLTVEIITFNQLCLLTMPRNSSFDLKAYF